MQNKRTSISEPDTSHTQMYHDARILGLSRDAKQRLKWIEHFEKYRNARLTCRHFGISPDTFYLWRKRYDSNNLQTLEDNKKSRRPHKLRVPKDLTKQIETVKKLKEAGPKMGKVKITKILKGLDFKVSPSTVTRILRRIDLKT